MRRITLLILLVLILTGCSGDDGISKAIALRQEIISSQCCTFDATVTADYGEKLYTFVMRCKSNATGSLDFEVLEPESISGITGEVSSVGGKLTFDNEVLAFELMADGQLTPVSAPWVLMHSLRSGYIRSCNHNDEGLSIQIDDSYRQNSLHLNLWTDANGILNHAEIFFDGRRILSLMVRNFQIL